MFLRRPDSPSLYPDTNKLGLMCPGLIPLYLTAIANGKISFYVSKRNQNRAYEGQANGNLETNIEKNMVRFVR